MAASRLSGPQLVVVPNVGMAIEGDRAFLDIKAVDGLRLYAALWPGRVLCIGRRVQPGSFGYGTWYKRAELPFEVLCVESDAGAEQIAPHCRDAALVLGGADSHLDLGLVDLLAPIPVALIIEYTLKTRIDMLRLGRGALLQKLKTGIWLLREEPARRRALRKAAGMQANGTPVFDAYGAASPSALLYFDTRLREELFIGLEAAEVKAAAVARSTALRLAFSGRLERVKGADLLVPVLAALHKRGVTHATLDIYGDGSLRPSIAAQAEKAGIGHSVRLHGPVPYEEVLVPTFQREVDLFLCCHPQADPSCTYLETLGCGVPIAGYLNDAFAGVLKLGDCGVGAPIGDVEGLAGAIAALDADRAELARLMRGAAAVAADNLCEDVFAKRVAHLRAICGL